MLTSAEIVSGIEAAEQAYLEKKYDEIAAPIQPVLEDFSGTGASKESYPSKTLARLVRILRNLGNDYDVAWHDQAQVVLDKALEWYPYPNDIKLVNEQGWLHYDRGYFDKALATFQQIRSGNSPPPQKDEKVSALRGAGASLRRLRRFLEAHEAFSEAVALAGEMPGGILVERGWLLFYQEKYDLAFADFQKVLDQAEAEEKDKQRAMNGQIASLQADAARNLDGDQSRAEELLGSWLKGPPGISQEEAVSIMSKAGAVHSYLNNYRAALLAYDLVLRFDPKNENAYEWKIDALKWLRRFDLARQVYIKAQQELPESVKLWNEMGHTFHQQKRHREALDYFNGKALTKRVFPSDQIKEKFVTELKNNQYANEWTIVSLRKMRDFAEAEKKVDEALVSFGDTANFLSEKAVIYFNRQEYGKAIALFDRVLKIDEYNEFAHQWRAASFRKQRQFDEASKAIEEALLKLPAATGLWEERAWLCFDQDDLNKADEYFAEAIKLDPYLIQRQFSRVEVLNRLNRNDEALKIFERLQEQFPDDAEVGEQLGWFQLRRGNLSQAKEEFLSIQDRDTENVLAVNGMGGFYLEQRDYKSAEERFRKSSKLVSFEPQYHVNLAWSLVRQVRERGEIPSSECAARERLIDDAEASCRAALKLDPLSANAYLCLGVIAFKRSAFLDAEGYFRKAVELSPRGGSHVELGSLYVQMGRYEEAKTEFSAAIKVNKNDARACIEMGNLLLLMENNKEAVLHCRRAVSIDPNNDEAHRALAIALMRAGQYDEAERALRKAINLIGKPRQWQLHLMLSQLLVSLGDDNNKDRELYNEALKHVNEAKRTNFLPNSEIYFHAGIVQYKLEDYRSAHRNFKDCLKANRERFEAERYSNLVKSMIREQRRVLRVNTWAGWGLAAICLLMLVFLGTFYYRGTTRIIPESQLLTLNNDNRQKINATQLEKLEAAKPAETPPKPKEELIVDKSMLTFMMPLLLGLLVVALLLPNLNKLKLPGGFEAEISELKTKETISSGPKGEIGFGSSLPIISPGPGGR